MEKNVKQTIFVLVPRDVWKNPKTQKWELGINSDIQKKADALITTVKAKLGKDVKVELKSYPTKKIENVKDWGVFIVKIPPHSKGVANYRTWFSRGILGESSKEDSNKLLEIEKYFKPESRN
jgi:hypothetical protein